MNCVLGLFNDTRTAQCSTADPWQNAERRSADAGHGPAGSRALVDDGGRPGMLAR
jgi:hypothetical protein